MKFRKKPIVIEAYQTEVPMMIHTLEGDMKAKPGDWIITGVKDEQYPCDDEIFRATYEPINEKEEPMKNNNELIGRISQELEDLSHKLDKHIALLESNEFNTVESRMQELLRTQYDAMFVYETILRQRIELLQEEVKL